MAAAAVGITAGGAQAAVGVPQVVEGDSGFAVYRVQEAADCFLDDPNYYASPDGSFGPQTLRVVKRFQEQHGLQQEGQVGPLTGTAVWVSVKDLISFRESGGGSIQTPWGVRSPTATR